ncbi:hypothetical protein, partial [Vibrio parahaemolyticus]|uniref:hypothetical protein n=1 Tax=Vibrio parahaemolyticus TaxID=670 RepID=UPI001C50085D
CPVSSWSSLNVEITNLLDPRRLSLCGSVLLIRKGFYFVNETIGIFWKSDVNESRQLDDVSGGSQVEY